VSRLSVADPTALPAHVLAAEIAAAGFTPARSLSGIHR
jgi:hypothetical protein